MSRSSVGGHTSGRGRRMRRQSTFGRRRVSGSIRRLQGFLCRSFVVVSSGISNPEVACVQEDIEQKSVALSIRATKLTSTVLAKAMVAFCRYAKKKYNEPKHGKQTVEQLARQNAGLENIEVTDANIKQFEWVARKYGVDYVLKRSCDDPTKWLVFFKARDGAALTAAFNEFSRDVLSPDKKPSVREAMRNYAELAKDAVLQRTPKVRERSRERGSPEW